MTDRIIDIQNSYPSDVKQTITADKVLELCGSLENGKGLEDQINLICGRIIRLRSQSKNLYFIDIINNNVKLQIVVMRQKYLSDNFETVLPKLWKYDNIEVTGYPYKTPRGELSLLASKVRLISPCLHTLQSIDAQSVINTENMYTHPYLRYMLDENAKNTIITRTKIIKFLRQFLDDKSFLEVETPILNKIPSGANAKPFITHHNELNRDMYLRIAPELNLKRLVIGTLERVYEIGMQFRNEGIDKTHMPSFTTCEFYMAHTDYYELMNMMEVFLSTLVMKIHNKDKIMVWEKEVDFKPPFRRIEVIPELEKLTLTKFPTDLTTDEANQFLLNLCGANHVDIGKAKTTAKLIDKMIEHYIEPQCINPTFVCDHPTIMSPLAKPHRDNQNVTERFELFVNCKELMNGYSELNIPSVQRQRFVEQLDQKKKGDDEAQQIDEEYCYALEHGLPPTGGCGIGIDRLVMILCDKQNIKDVLTFPDL
jgi:lysyl-tRNA synthetase class 2